MELAIQIRAKVAKERVIYVALESKAAQTESTTERKRK